MTPHLVERFYQRYGRQLTLTALREIVQKAPLSRDRVPDKYNPDRELVYLYWDGIEIRIAWHARTRTVFTFLPGRVKFAAYKMGRSRRRRG